MGSLCSNGLRIRSVTSLPLFSYRTYIKLSWISTSEEKENLKQTLFQAVWASKVAQNVEASIQQDLFVVDRC